MDFLWTDKNSSTLCLQIVSEKQNLPLGFSCSEITRVKEGDRKTPSNKNDFLKANITYEVETLPQSNTTPINHVIDYSGELKIKDKKELNL